LILRRHVAMDILRLRSWIKPRTTADGIEAVREIAPQLVALAHARAEA
jgi:hypothetical protein